MRIPVPQNICQQISQNAVRHAREEMNGYGWSDKSIEALQGMSNEGLAGIRLSSKYFKYLMYQERGINHPWLMWWVNDHPGSIPLGCKQGDGPHFRRGGGGRLGPVGTAGYVDIPHVGRVWRDQRWRHPGIKSRNFMHNGLNKAVAEAQPQLKAYAKSLFKGIVE